MKLSTYENQIAKSTGVNVRKLNYYANTSYSVNVAYYINKEDEEPVEAWLDIKRGQSIENEILKWKEKILNN